MTDEVLFKQTPTEALQGSVDIGQLSMAIELLTIAKTHYEHGKASTRSAQFALSRADAEFRAARGCLLQLGELTQLSAELITGDMDALKPAREGRKETA